jgi:hypothetical protein
MKIPIYLLLIVLLTAFSCKKEGDSPQAPCAVANPAQDLPWLKEKIEALSSLDSSYEYIQQATYQGQTVFIFRNCCENCNSTAPVYNCRGEVICTLYSKECPDIMEALQAQSRKIIATAKKSLCYF